MASNGDGLGRNFRFLAVPPGRYWLGATAVNFLAKDYGKDGAPSRPTTISLSPGQKIDNIDVRIDPAGAISGTVYDEDNKPVEGVMVTAVHPEYLHGSQPILGDGSTSDEFGEFRISGLSPGSYYIRAGDERDYSGRSFVYRPTFYPGTPFFENALTVQVTGGAEISGIRFRGLQMERAYAIHARIIDPNRSSQRRYELTLDPISHNLSGTSSDTSFVLDGLPQGDHVLTAWAIDPASTEEGWVVAGKGYATVQITDKDQQVDVPFGNGAAITGKVTVDSPAFSTAGLPVWLQRSGGTAKTDASGAFTMHDIAPGHYTFFLPTLSKLAYEKRVQCSGIDYTTRPLDLREGMSPIDCEIALSTHPGMIQGQVLDDGKPVSGMVVVLIPESRELRQLERYTQITQSGPNGAFEIAAAIPGEYFLFAVPKSNEQPYYALDFADRNRNNARHVSIQEGETQVIDLKPLKEK